MVQSNASTGGRCGRGRARLIVTGLTGTATLVQSDVSNHNNTWE
jgi:hypothetical protein